MYDYSGKMSLENSISIEFDPNISNSKMFGSTVGRRATVWTALTAQVIGQTVGYPLGYQVGYLSH